MLELDRVALASAAKEGTKEALPIQENAPIKIHVFADNTIWIGNTCVKTEDPTLLEEMCLRCRTPFLKSTMIKKLFLVPIKQSKMPWKLLVLKKWT
ncbi:MAG: hypothetical protein H7A42_07535 [Chlamydiales bacterium]|nr:hypothetical protein [Chlamydiales bacterium]